MRVRQHLLGANAPITDHMTSGAVGVSWHRIIGQTVDLVYEIPDSDRTEVLLRLTDGTSILVSCDPGYDASDRRTPEHWETVVYDTTETEAGKKLRDLESGHWL